MSIMKDLIKQVMKNGFKKEVISTKAEDFEILTNEDYMELYKNNKLIARFLIDDERLELIDSNEYILADEFLNTLQEIGWDVYASEELCKKCNYRYENGIKINI